MNDLKFKKETNVFLNVISILVV